MKCNGYSNTIMLLCIQNQSFLSPFYDNVIHLSFCAHNFLQLGAGYKTFQVLVFPEVLLYIIHISS